MRWTEQYREHGKLSSSLGNQDRVRSALGSVTRRLREIRRARIEADNGAEIHLCSRRLPLERGKHTVAVRCARNYSGEIRVPMCHCIRDHSPDFTFRLITK